MPELQKWQSYDTNEFVGIIVVILSGVLRKAYRIGCSESLGDGMLVETDTLVTRQSSVGAAC
jgi:hypothetical protein